jgi:cob(I)alamin adenosyltransferase
MQGYTFAMVRITKVYTKKGDRGATKLIGAKSVSKISARVKVLGSLDELNAFLGWANTALAENRIFFDIQQKLLRIQNILFDFGAELVARSDKLGVTATDVKLLEEEIDLMNRHLVPLNSFVLPGSEEISARLHIARTICRRTERDLVALNAEEKINALQLAFLNRLSDWLFVSSRYVTIKLGKKELLWKPEQR